MYRTSDARVSDTTPSHTMASRLRFRTPLFRRLTSLVVAVLTATLGTVVVAAAPAQASLVTSGTGRMFYFLGRSDSCLGVTKPGFDAVAVDTVLTVWSCEGHFRQKFNRNSAGQIQAENGLCIGMRSPWLSASEVRTVACNPSTRGQIWNIESHPMGGHYYTTTNNAGSKLCLRAHWTGSAYVPFADTCANSWDRRFYLDWHSTFRYVALGDSFSAGNGAGNYVDRNCYNSWNNYANVLDDAFREVGRAVPYTWPFGPSCSGAQTGAVPLVPWVTGGGGYWTAQRTASGYTRQAQQGFLSQPLDLATGNYGSGFNGAETTLVTMTMGGNDLGFAAVLAACVTGDCTANNREQTLLNAMPGLGNALKGVYLDLGRKAPNAQIRIPDYPLPVAVTDPWYCRVGVSDDEIRMMERVQGELNRTIATAVANSRLILGHRIRAVPVAAHFAGHSACSADPWTTGNQLGDSNEWYHLNARGHLEIARLIRNTL